ncbi:MAG: hypothetical protein IJ876_02005, partial [Elusimicrobiaceae bacterium]|nr:hypothetical protein [Elusimicrobiaceae bacterium]
ECGEKPASERDCGCGYKQYSWWKCDETTNYQWEIQTGSNVMGSGHSVGNDGWTPCAKPSGSRRAECPDLQVGSDLNGSWIKAYTYEDWNDDTCQWELRDSECCQKHNDKNEACTDGKKGTGIVYEWHYPTCRYVVKSSDCYTTKKVWEQETYRDSITRRNSDCGGCLEDHHGTYICNSEKAKAWWDSQSSHYPEDTYPMCSDIGVSAGMSAENYSGPTTCVLVKASYQGCGTTSTGWGSQTGSDVGYVWPDGHTTRNIYNYAVIKRQYTVLYVTEKVVK